MANIKFLDGLNVTGEVRLDDKLSIDGTSNPYIFIHDETNETYTGLWSGNTEGVLTFNHSSFRITSGVSFTGTDLLTITDAGAIKFNTYGAGYLKSDASGNITAAGASQVGPFLPLAGGTLTGDLTLDANSGSSPDIFLKNVSNNYARILFDTSDQFVIKIGTSNEMIMSTTATTFDSSITAKSAVLSGPTDGILTLNQTGTDTGWSYINFQTNNVRNYYVGQDSDKNWEVYNDNIDVTAISVSYASNLTTIGGDLTVAGGDITLSGTGRIQGVDTVSASTDAANKAYVDTAVGGAGSGTFLPLAGGTMTGNTLHGDSVKSIFGAGNDLQIYHDGSNSFIKDDGTGDLVILSNAVSINNAANTENIAKFLADSTVKLYYDNVQKFQTTSTGIEVSGTASSFAGRVIIGDDAITTDKPGLVVGDTTNNGQITIRGGQPTLFFDKSGTNDAVILTDSVNLKFKNGTLDSEGSDQLILDTSGNATFAGNITSTGTSIILDSAGSAGYIADRANDTSGATYEYKTGGSLKWYTGLRGVSTEDFYIFNNAQGSTALLINSSNNNATFAGQVNGITPTSAANLTRKDYVDAAVAGVPQGTVTSVSTGNANTLIKSGTSAVTLTPNTGVVSSTSSNLATGAQIQTAIDTATTGALKFVSEWDASGLNGGSPDLRQTSTHVPGSYYIVSTAGGSTPNGSGTSPSEWAVGDWCVRSDLATDTWQKIDNTQVGSVNGTGSTNRLAFWSSNTNITSDSRLKFETLGMSSRKLSVDGSVFIDAGYLSITADGSNAVTFTESGAGLMTIAAPDDIVLDSGSDIILDAGGDDIRLKVNGTEYAKFDNASSNLNITSSIQDKDIKFHGNDGGTGIVALTLDMSNGGSATFRDDIDMGGSLNMTGSSKVIRINSGGYIDFDSTNLQFNTQRNPNTGAFNDANKSHAHIGLQGANGGSEIIFATAAANNTTATTRMTIDSSGNATFAGDVLPSAENAHNIGSASLRWEDLYVDDGFIRDAYIDDNIYHNGDTDTKIVFSADRQTYYAGGDEFIDFREATESYITLGNSNDTDTRMQGGAGYIFIQGSNGYIGINDATPSYPFQVSANTVIEGTLQTTDDLTITQNSGSLQFSNTGSGHGSINTGSSKDLNIGAASGNVYINNNTTFAGNITLQDSGTTYLNMFKSGGLAFINTGASGGTVYFGAPASNVTNVNVQGVMDADNFKINGAQGTNGQVLTSTGSGVQWGTAGGTTTQTVLFSNFSDDTSSTSAFRIPFNTLTDTTSNQYYNTFDCPADGTIKRIRMQNTKGTLSTGFTTIFDIWRNSTQTPTQSSGSLTASGGSIEYEPNLSFSKGDKVMIAYRKSASSKYWRGVSASIIIEFTKV